MEKEIITKYLPLCRNRANDFCKGWNVPHKDREDFIAQSYLTLLELSNEYDESRGMKFINYLINMLRFRLIDFYRAEYSAFRRYGKRDFFSKSKANTVFIDDPDFVDTLELSYNGTEEKVIKKDIIEKLLRSVKSKCSVEYMKRHYLNDEPQKDIADSMNRRPAAISFGIALAKQRMRERAEVLR